jgi:co-chaperonin GroES (HSP10)
MKAFRDNVVLKPARAPEESAGGIVLPESVGREYKCRGFIIDVGPDCKDEIEVGNEVIFTTGSKFTVDNQEYLVVKAVDILVVV